MVAHTKCFAELTTPAAPSKEASRHFLDAASTPPVPGGEHPRLRLTVLLVVSSLLQRVRPFVQLDVCAPGIVNKRKRGPGLGILRVGPVQLDARRLEFPAERFQVLDVEADVIEHPSSGGNRRHVRAGNQWVPALPGLDANTRQRRGTSPPQNCPI